MTSPFRLLSSTAVVLGLVFSSVAQAESVDVTFYKGGKPPSTGGGGGGGGGSTSTAYYDWMDPEIKDAWAAKFYGQGVTLTVVDDYSSSDIFNGDFGTGLGTLEQQHGYWTSLEASLIAPGAKIVRDDFATPKSVSLASGLNVLNLSYGMIARSGYSGVRWSQQESSIINYATNGSAVVVESSGNESRMALNLTYEAEVGQAYTEYAYDSVNKVFVATGNTLQNYLARDLIGTQGTIFAGAVECNTSGTGCVNAYYSTIAGDNTLVQNQYLVVEVDRGVTGLAGTSFAAPIISGYAAVLGSKFTSATPAQIVDQLLATAKTDVIVGYNERQHGQGMASIKNALAPTSILP